MRLRRREPFLSDGREAGNPLLVDAALLLVVSMWASTFTLFKVAWRQMDPVAFTGVRFGAMVLISVVLVVADRGRTRLRREDLPRLIASAFLGYFLYQMAFVLGLDRTTAIAAAVLVATNPIFSVIFVWLSGRERPNRVQVAGVVIGFVGVAVFLQAWNAVGAATWGDLLALAAAAAFGAYGVVTPPLSARYPGRMVMAYGLLIGGTLVTLVSIPAMLRQDWSSVSASAWLITAFAAIGPVYIAYALWNWAIHERGVSRTVVYGFIPPVLAGLMAALVLHERIGPAQVIGAVLVLAGLAVTRVLGGRRVATEPEPEPAPIAQATPSVESSI